MTEAEDKEKAEKLAAAKKKYEQLKRQKNKKAEAAKKKDEPTTVAETSADHGEAGDGGQHVNDTERGEANGEDNVEAQQREVKTEALAEEPKDNGTSATENREDVFQPPGADQPSHSREPSLSLESRMRSESFRRTSFPQPAGSPSPGALKSPTLPPSNSSGDSLQDLYKKQALRIDELEKENVSLQKEAQDGETRWRGLEEELESARESNGEYAGLRAKAKEADSKAEELERLKNENASLQRQNAQLQSAASKPPKAPSKTSPPSSNDDLVAQLESKSSTIEDMELTISNLRAEFTSSSNSTEAHTTRISALEGSLARAEKVAESALRDLADLRANLSRTSERNANESSARISAETRATQLESSLAAAQKAAAEAGERIKALEQKVEALTTLHRESDARSQGRLREFERIEKEGKELRSKLNIIGNENARLRETSEKRKKAEVQGADDGGVDELEEEECAILRSKIRELETEVFDLRRGVWREKRVDLQGDMPPEHEGPTSPGFDDVDLTGTNSPPRTAQKRGSSLQDVINSGLSAFTGGRQDQRRRGLSGPRLLAEEDEFGGEFDEDAFRVAQEEEGKKRIERVRELKRGLKEWAGWRMDLVDSRVGVGGWGEVFDV